MTDRNTGGATGRPRHIRDIAHLYLSRRRRTPASVGLAVVVRGEDRACFPAWHVANLAVALAGRRMSVWVGEYSGLLPSTAFYLGLPPREYMTQDAVPRFHEALAGVQVSVVPTTEPGSTVEVAIYHVPPAAREGEEGPGHPGVPTDGSAVELTIRHRRAAQRRSAAITTASGATLELSMAMTPGAIAGVTVGLISGWEAHVGDRLPIVLARPSSVLARSYLGVCDALVARAEATRRKVERDERAEAEPRSVERSNR